MFTFALYGVDMSGNNPERRGGCLRKLGYFGATSALLLGGAAVYEFISQPTPTAHSVHTINWPLGDAQTVLTYDRNLAAASFKSSSPKFSIELRCSPENVGIWKINAPLFGKEITQSFEVDSNEETFSPCKDGMVNDEYDKAAAGRFISLAGDALQNRFFDLIRWAIFPKPLE